MSSACLGRIDYRRSDLLSLMHALELQERLLALLLKLVAQHL